jgi:hypothetical protein
MDLINLVYVLLIQWAVATVGVGLYAIYQHSAKWGMVFAISAALEILAVFGLMVWIFNVLA